MQRNQLCLGDKMAYLTPRFGSFVLAACLLLLILPAPVAAFGAGNIPSIAQVEGKNFRHGGTVCFDSYGSTLANLSADIEDMLKTIAFIKGHKWTTMMVKRTYFGNWLRDYSQAVDVGSLKGVNAPTIRILVRKPHDMPKLLELKFRRSGSWASSHLAMLRPSLK